MTQYVLSSLVKVSRLDGEGRPVLHSGDGDGRAHFALEGAASQPMLELLFGLGSPVEEQDLVDSLVLRGGLGGDEAREFVTGMIDAKVIVPDEECSGHRSRLAQWGHYGWRDAADYHVATFGLRFSPDEIDGIAYADLFGQMMADSESAGPQPPAHVMPEGSLWPVPALVASAEPALDAVLAGAMPINRFEGPAARAAEILPALRRGFGVQKVVGGMLGEHHLRSYPSGGARHPFEIYLVSKGLDDLPEGVYNFDPVGGGLNAVQRHGAAADIDAACFGKGGILTADAVVILTCRWLRHSWKYRYARSYRMLLLEAGHVVQAVTLAMIRQGLNVYHCPSIDDTLVGAILGLGDDCAEGPVYALGLGHGGIR